ncbi:hypothetical protein ACHAXA_008505 [Cyclostephanos tholiformis]|uniref:CBM6 domain-containing protein n=1 Tax=Cyclostephanos tholiformis TaxID=382380 RepID=A0ABD3RR78_9STRA
MLPNRIASVVAAFIGIMRFSNAGIAEVATSTSHNTGLDMRVIVPKLDVPKLDVPKPTEWMVPSKLPYLQTVPREHIATTVIYEAEDAATYDPTSVVDSTNPGARGNKYIDMGGMGSYLEFVVDDEDEDDIDEQDALASNDCSITFRYASASRDGHTRPCSLSVNGTIVDTLSFPTTFWWRRWDTKVVREAAYCSPGTVIRLTAVSKHGGPNIDYMALDFMYKDKVEAAGSLRGYRK